MRFYKICVQYMAPFRITSPELFFNPNLLLKRVLLSKTFFINQTDFIASRKKLFFYILKMLIKAAILNLSFLIIQNYININ